MLKKTLLKNTHEFLEKNFPENFFLKRKKNKKKQKLIVSKTSILKKRLSQFNSKNLLLLHRKNDIPKKFSVSRWPFALQSNENLVSANKHTNYLSSNKAYTDFLFSMHMIKSEFEKKQNRNSDFKIKLKERKKLSILYGNLSSKQIKKTLHHANKLQGNTGNNLIILLESRLDVILYRALFFSSLKFARKYIKYNKILVNSQPVNIHSYKVKFGDIVSVENKYKKCLGKNILKHFLKYDLCTKNSIENQFSLKLNKENFKFKIQEKFLFNVVISNQTKLIESKTLSLSKSMLSSNKLKLKKNKHSFNFIRSNNLVLNSSESFLNFFNLNFPFNNLSRCKNESKKKQSFFTPKSQVNKALLYLQATQGINKVNTVDVFVKKSPAGTSLRKNDVLSNHRFKQPLEISKPCFPRAVWHRNLPPRENQKCFTKNRWLEKTSFFPRQAFAELLHYNVTSLQKKSKFKIGTSKNIYLNRNFFFDKQRYTISNFDLAFIQNQIKPLNKILLRKSLHKLNEILKINNFILYTEKYKIFTKTSSIVIKHPKNFVSLIKKSFLLNEKKINVKLKILLTNLNKTVIKQSKQLIINNTNKSSDYNIEKKFYTNNLILLNVFKHYDILFFLKLKNLFFKKREFFNFRNLNKKVYFKKNKPLNLEISYKSLSIIHLFPCQKIVFPCSLDVDLLY